MLYLTSRNKNDAYTAHWALTQDYSPDGGAYVPFKLPELSGEVILALKDKSFGQNVADILNLFFPAKLTGWDVDVLIGRAPVRFEQMNHRIVVAETWHNLDNDFTHVVAGLYGRLAESAAVPTEWAQIAIRIAVLFGIWGELLSAEITDGTSTLDIAVASGDFDAPVAAWYAKAMGLPVGTIICGCADNGALWDLLHYGSLSAAAITDDRLATRIERLIHGILGLEEAARFAKCRESRSTYIVREDLTGALSQGIFAAVIGEERVKSVINSVYRTGTYMIDPVGAVAYGGLQDYRASTGESRLTLLLSDSSPMNQATLVANAMGITPSALNDRVKLP